MPTPAPGRGLSPVAQTIVRAGSSVSLCSETVLAVAPSACPWRTFHPIHTRLTALRYHAEPQSDTIESRTATSKPSPTTTVSLGPNAPNAATWPGPLLTWSIMSSPSANTTVDLSNPELDLFLQEWSGVCVGIMLSMLTISAREKRSKTIWSASSRSCRHVARSGRVDLRNEISRQRARVTARDEVIAPSVATLERDQLVNFANVPLHVELALEAAVVHIPDLAENLPLRPAAIVKSEAPGHSGIRIRIATV